MSPEEIGRTPASEAQEAKEEEPTEVYFVDVGGVSYLSDRGFDQAHELGEIEKSWLEALIDNDRSASMSDIMLRGRKDLGTFIRVNRARTSLKNKLNSFTDGAGERPLAAQVTDEDGSQRLTLTERIELKNDYLDGSPVEAYHGHPSAIDFIAMGELAEFGDHDSSALPSLQFLGKRAFDKPGPFGEAVRQLVLDRLKGFYDDVSEEDLEWIHHRRCYYDHPRTFHSRSGKGDAMRQCRNCKVAEACMEFALRNDIRTGIWGGKTKRERSDIAYQRKIDAMKARVRENLGKSAESHLWDLARTAKQNLREYFENEDNGSHLFETQQPAIEALSAFWQNRVSEFDGYLSMPTGTGKTAIFIELVKATGLRTVIAAPTQDLVRQTLREFGKFHEEADIGMVYSDEKDPDSQIVVTTYHSLRQQLLAEDGLFDAAGFELLILDEAHKGMGKRTRKLIESLDHMLKVGFTATEAYSEDRKLEEILPKEIFKMELREAIDAELIVPYHTIFVDGEVNLSQVTINPNTEDYREDELQEAVAVEHRNQIAVDLYKEHFEGQKAVFFCAGVDHAVQISEMLQKQGVQAEAIYGDLRTKDRQRIIKQSEQPIKEGGLEVVTNAKLLAEGWDNPAFSVCFNLAPTLSRVRSQQRSGRVLRIDSKWPDKVATIVEFIDHDYPREPVTFPDPDVSGEAVYFANGETDLGRLVNIESGESVTSDPEKVKRLALDMNESRRKAEDLPPLDWMTEDELFEQFEHSSDIIRLYFDVFRYMSDFYKDNAQNTSHVFWRKHPERRGAQRVFSPEVQKEFREFIEKAAESDPDDLSELLPGSDAEGKLPEELS